MINLFRNSNGYSANNDNYNFETLQKARKGLVGEIQAIIEYDEHIHSTNDTIAIKTWQSIKNEELKHVGELLALANFLDSTQIAFVEDGIKEFNYRLS